MNNGQDDPTLEGLRQLTMWGWLLPFGLFMLVLLLGVGVALFYTADEDEASHPSTQETLAPPLEVSQALLEQMTTLQGNADWQPFYQEVDGVSMVLVPYGCFVMGKPPASSAAAEAQTVCFDKPFWIDRYEVSNGQYLAKVRQGQPEAQCQSTWCEDDRPREGISWEEAQAYCALRGGRLPTSAEWEYVGRGLESWLYPWGNTFDPARLVYRGIFRTPGQGYDRAETYPVAAFPQGASWVGAEQMVGNVQEWVLDNPGGLEGEQLLRGGLALNNNLDLLTAFRSGTLTALDDYNGFRCLRQ